MELGKEPLPGISSFRRYRLPGTKSSRCPDGPWRGFTPALACVNLDSQIDDVADILKRENLHGATLVGHSDAGMVITGVAERESGRLSRLIYVDAFVPDSGQGRAVSIGIITSCPPAMIAIWKPLRDLFLPC
jgi:pimeloyl-ACP methyl ester carboxylesterase